MSSNDAPSQPGMETLQEILRTTLSKIGDLETQEIELKALPDAPTSNTEPVPHLHARTFLVVFAVCFIYFAQLVNLVGPGVVRSLRFCERRISDVFFSLPAICPPLWVDPQMSSGLHHLLLF